MNLQVDLPFCNMNLSSAFNYTLTILLFLLELGQCSGSLQIVRIWDGEDFDHQSSVSQVIAQASITSDHPTLSDPGFCLPLFCNNQDREIFYNAGYNDV